MPAIYRLMYCSVAKKPAGDPTDLEILRSAVANNSKQEVTGILLRTETGFVQVLEGSEAAVKDVYRSVQTDPRHHNVTLLGDWRDDKRMFAAWAMEFRTLDNPTAQALIGSDPTKIASTPLLFSIHKLAHMNMGLFQVR